MLDEEPLFTPLTIKKIEENAQKSKEWKPVGRESVFWHFGTNCQHDRLLIGEVNDVGPRDIEFFAKHVECRTFY